MGVKNVSMVLDHTPEGGIFKPGAIVSGRVKVTTDKPTQIKYINIHFEGKAKVSFNARRIYWFKEKHPSRKYLEFGDILDVDWNAITFKKSLSDSCYFRALQMFVNAQIGLAGETCLQLGVTEYPFCFSLPDDLPSTFCGAHGQIRHKLKVKWAHSGFLTTSDTYKVELRVENCDSLQFLQVRKPSFFEPRLYEITKSFKVIFSSNHPVTVVINLPKSAFIDGEVVHAGIEIHNESKVTIKAVLVKLIERTTWIGKHSLLKTVKMDDKIVKEISYDGIPSLGSRGWTQPIELLVPPTINIDTCSVIKLCHFIVIEVVPCGMYSNLSWFVPLKVFFESSEKQLLKKMDFNPSSDASTSGFSRSSSSQPPPYEAPPPYSQINHLT